MHRGDFVAVQKFPRRAIPIADAPQWNGAAQVVGDCDIGDRSRRARIYRDASRIHSEFVFINAHRVGAGKHIGHGKNTGAGGGVRPVLRRRVRKTDRVGMARVALRDARARDAAPTRRADKASQPHRGNPRCIERRRCAAIGENQGVGSVEDVRAKWLRLRFAVVDDVGGFLVRAALVQEAAIKRPA